MAGVDRNSCGMFNLAIGNGIYRMVKTKIAYKLKIVTTITQTA